MDYPSKEFVEALLSGVITSLTNAVGAVSAVVEGFESKDGKLTPTRALKGLVAVCMVEAEKVEHCLSPYGDNSLRLKHLYCRTIFRTFTAFLEGDDVKAVTTWADERDIEHDAVATAVLKHVLRFLAVFHGVLHEDTPRDTRSRLARQYTGAV